MIENNNNNDDNNIDDEITVEEIEMKKLEKKFLYLFLAEILLYRLAYLYLENHMEYTKIFMIFYNILLTVLSIIGIRYSIKYKKSRLLFLFAGYNVVAVIIMIYMHILINSI